LSALQTLATLLDAQERKTTEDASRCVAISELTLEVLRTLRRGRDELQQVQTLYRSHLIKITIKLVTRLSPEPSDVPVENMIQWRLLELPRFICSRGPDDCVLDEYKDTLWDALGGGDVAARWFRLAADTGHVWSEGASADILHTKLLTMSAATMSRHVWNCLEAFFADVNVAAGSLTVEGRVESLVGRKLCHRALVGRRLKVLWVDDKKLHIGEIIDFQESQSERSAHKHTIRWIDPRPYTNVDTYDFNVLTDYDLVDDAVADANPQIAFVPKHVVDATKLIGIKELWRVALCAETPEVATAALHVAIELLGVTDKEAVQEVMRHCAGEEGDSPAMAAKKHQVRVNMLALLGDVAGVSAEMHDEFDVNATVDNLTLLQVAAREGHLEIVKLLLSKGADPDAADSKGNTPLMLAADASNPKGTDTQVIEALIDAGARMDLQNVEGWTALMYACHGKPGEEAALCLIERGANTALLHNAGGSARTIAAGHGTQKVVVRLLALCADPLERRQETLRLLQEMRRTDYYGEVEIVVDLDNLVESSMISLEGLADGLPFAAKHIRVRYTRSQGELGEAELGTDMGGVFRDWVSRVGREVFDPNAGLVLPVMDESERTTGFYKLNHSPSMLSEPEAYAAHFRFMGRLIAISLASANAPLGIRLTRACCKALTAHPVEFGDLEQDNPALYRSYSKLREMSREEVEALDLCWTAPSREAMVAQAFGMSMSDITRQESAVNPSKAVTDPVSFEDLGDYCNKLAQKVMFDNVVEATGLVRGGIVESLPEFFTQLLTPEDIALALAGEVDVDIADWRDNTEVDGFASHAHAPVCWFWSFLERSPNVVRQDMLQFMTGMRCAPFGGFSSVGNVLRIVRDTRGPGHLPNCQTCSFQLNLPDIPTEEAFLEKLQQALELARAAGFGMA